MRSNQRSAHIHTFLFVLLCIALAVLASLGTFLRTRAASPNSGTINAGDAFPATWAGDNTLATGATDGESNCIDSGPQRTAISSL